MSVIELSQVDPRTLNGTGRVGLLDSTGTYDVDRYAWAYEFWKRQQQTHWMGEEVPLGADLKDWASDRVTANERNLLTQIFRFFTQSDIEVGDNYLKRYIPIDVSERVVRDAAEQLVEDYDGLKVHGVVGDFERHIGRLPEGRHRLVAFLGSSIGNLVGEERARFLAELREYVQPGEALLLGTDLVKDPARLDEAYNDSHGVTAEFNRNVLAVVNRELHANFDLQRFTHVARYNPEAEWVELFLRSDIDQTVTIGDLGLAVPFATGEEMLTEISDKFRREGVVAELQAAGFELRRWWTDPHEDFALSLALAV